MKICKVLSVRIGYYCAYELSVRLFIPDELTFLVDSPELFMTRKGKKMGETLQNTGKVCKGWSDDKASSERIQVETFPTNKTLDRVLVPCGSGGKFFDFFIRNGRSGWC